MERKKKKMSKTFDMDCKPKRRPTSTRHPECYVIFGGLILECVTVCERVV